MKNVVLQEMSEAGFAAFAQKSIADYAKDLTESGQLCEEEALQKARAEFEQMLPAGPQTPDQFLRTILDARTQRPVGAIWYLFEETGGKRQVFLSDLLIDEADRRRGFARGALREMEAAAKRAGCAESVLYVRRGNLPALALYRKCGYLPFRGQADGTYLKKAL